MTAHRLTLTILDGIRDIDSDGGLWLVQSLPPLHATCPRLCEWLAAALASRAEPSDPDFTGWSDREIGQAMQGALTLVNAGPMPRPAAAVVGPLSAALAMHASTRLLLRDIARTN